MENSIKTIDNGVIQRLEIIKENAEGVINYAQAIIDDVAETLAFISEKQEAENKKSNICLVHNFYEHLEKINKRRRKKGLPPLKPLIID